MGEGEKADVVNALLCMQSGKITVVDMLEIFKCGLV